jgi:hypothetical protein
MGNFRIVLLLVFAFAQLLRATGDVPPKLTAEQYTHAEDLYWKVMARCCIRKPGAAGIHQQIERQVAEGRSDSAILADFARRYGGGPVNLDRQPAPGTGGWMILPALGAALVATGVLVKWGRKGWGKGSPRRLRKCS